MARNNNSTQSVPSLRVAGFVFGCLVGKSVHDLDTDLLWEGQLDGLASGGSQCCQALLKSFRIILDLRDSDTFLFGEVFAADSWEGDGFVVAGLLGDLLAVVLSISVSMTISVLGRLTHSHHLGLTLLVERNLHSLGSGDFTLRLIRVAADLVVDFFRAFSTDCTSYSVTLFSVNYSFNSKFYRSTFCFQSRGADLSQLNHVLHSAVVFGVFIAIAWLRIAVLACRSTSDQGDHGEKENLHDVGCRRSF